MPKLRVQSGKEIVKTFIGFGFTIQSQKGSHIKLVRILGTQKQVLVVPNYNEIDTGTIKAIYRQAGKYISEIELNPFFYTD
jgi:predicted RNA binding protein YcfA (HicA-like mRNA interferase family)